MRQRLDYWAPSAFGIYREERTMQTLSSVHVKPLLPCSVAVEWGSHLGRSRLAAPSSSSSCACTHVAHWPLGRCHLRGRPCIRSSRSRLPIHRSQSLRMVSANACWSVYRSSASSCQSRLYGRAHVAKRSRYIRVESLSSKHSMVKNRQIVEGLRIIDSYLLGVKLPDRLANACRYRTSQERSKRWNNSQASRFHWWWAS